MFLIVHLIHCSAFLFLQMSVAVPVIIRAVEDPVDPAIIEIVDQDGEVAVLGYSEECSICLGPFLPGEYLVVLRCQHR